MKLFIALTLSLYILNFPTTAQQQPDVKQWPIPQGISNLLFYLQRDPDANTVCYTANLLDNETLDPKMPVKIFWKKYGSNGKIEDLNPLQKKLAYGLSWRIIKEDVFLLKSVAFPEKQLYLLKDRNSTYIVQTKINGKPCTLKRVYIRIHRLSKISPKVAYIEFTGVFDPTGETLTERINI